MITELLPTAVFIYVEAYGKCLYVSERGLTLLKQYLKVSSHENNDKLCTFGQFSRLTNDETAKEFENEFVKPSVKKWGSDLVDTNGSENPNYWKIDLKVLVQKINLAKQEFEGTAQYPSVKKEHGKISTENWSLISNPRVFDVEIYIQDKGSKHREAREFPITLEYEDVKAWADFFNDQVADLQKKGKLK